MNGLKRMLCALAAVCLGTAEAAVAQIGGTEYATLTAALTAAQAGQTIQLGENVTLGTMTCDKNVTFDLNGCNMAIPAGVVFTVRADLTIVDTRATQGGIANSGRIDVVSGTLDLTTLGYGATGLLANHPGALFIAAGATVKYMSAWAAPMSYIAANNPKAALAQKGALAVANGTTYICTVASDESSTPITASSWDTVNTVPVTIAEGAVVQVPFPASFFPSTVAEADRAAYVEAADANGLKRWQNYLMGVDGTVEANKLCTVSGGVTGETVTFKTPIEAFDPPAGTGVTVTYVLRKSTDGAQTWKDVRSVTGGTPSFAVDLSAEPDGDTLWKIAVVFTTTAL